MKLYEDCLRKDPLALKLKINLLSESYRKFCVEKRFLNNTNLLNKA